MKKYILLYIIVWSAVILFLLSCAAGKKSVKRITVTPDSCVLMPDTAGNIVLETTFRIPGHYVSKRSRLIIVPQLLVNGEVRKELAPLVVDAPIYEKRCSAEKSLMTIRTLTGLTGKQ